MPKSELDPRLQAAREDQEQRDAEVKRVVAQVHKARKSAEEAANSLILAANTLRALIRKTSDDATSAHISFATAHLRAGGAIIQGLKRSASLDRILDSANQVKIATRLLEEKAAQAKVEARPVRRTASVHNKLELTSDNALEELYGEINTDAV